MPKLSFVFLITLFIALETLGQKKPAEDTAPPKPDKTAPLNRMVNVDSAVTTRADVTIKGQHVPYTATAGTMPVWDEDGKAIASVFYTYYERTDVKDRASRPLVISFNGGPGTPSVWMRDIRYSHTG
jgi:carboxypeptidase C (cathepsin A)